MKPITYTAPGKVIFSGEHAVVYGKPAILTAIQERLSFSIWEDKTKKKDTYIEYAALTVQNYIKKNNIPVIKHDYDYRISSTIPIGSGLGSSAAFSVATAGAFLEFFTGQTFSIENINNVAFLIEKQFHSRPSGADTSTSSFGGLIYFRKEFDFLKTISQLHITVPEQIEKNLFLVNTGRPEETTYEMVELVGREYNSNPKHYYSLMSNIEKVTKKMVISLMQNDTQLFKKTLYENEVMLEELGIVSKKTKVFLNSLREYGIGKVSGAGGIKAGSGYLLFCQHEGAHFENVCAKLNIQYIKFKPEYKGVLKI